MLEAEKNFGKVTKKKGTSIIFINNENKILLFLRDDNHQIPFPNCWDILGGHVEKFETPEECIIRELMEEIEVKITKPKLYRVEDMDDRIEHTFWQTANFDIDEIKLNEGQKLKWFSEEEVKAMPDRDIAFNFKKIIMDFFLDKPFAK